MERPMDLLLQAQGQPDLLIETKVGQIRTLSCWLEQQQQFFSWNNLGCCMEYVLVKNQYHMFIAYDISKCIFHPKNKKQYPHTASELYEQIISHLTVDIKQKQLSSVWFQNHLFPLQELRHTLFSKAGRHLFLSLYSKYFLRSEMPYQGLDKEDTWKMCHKLIWPRMWGSRKTISQIHCTYELLKILHLTIEQEQTYFSTLHPAMDAIFDCYCPMDSFIVCIRFNVDDTIHTACVGKWFGADVFAGFLSQQQLSQTHDLQNFVQSMLQCHTSPMIAINTTNCSILQGSDFHRPSKSIHYVNWFQMDFPIHNTYIYDIHSYNYWWKVEEVIRWRDEIVPFTRPDMKKLFLTQNHFQPLHEIPNPFQWLHVCGFLPTKLHSRIQFFYSEYLRKKDFFEFLKTGERYARKQLEIKRI